MTEDERYQRYQKAALEYFERFQFRIRNSPANLVDEVWSLTKEIERIKERLEKLEEQRK